ncbi:MAG: hypothetical protein NTZ02_03745 [Candidatus Woesearchaeota archaeon]|nr:hypothetical protein [Candidatus Woesearchaeota archaeon]
MKSNIDETIEKYRKAAIDAAQIEANKINEQRDKTVNRELKEAKDRELIALRMAHPQNLGDRIKNVGANFKDKINLKREIADAEKNRPELQGYRNRISAEQAAKSAEWAQRKQSFMESFPAKIPGFAGITGACIGLYFMEIPLTWLIIGWIALILIILFIPGRKVLQFLIIVLILGALIYFVPIFLPLAQSYAQQNKGAPALKGSIASVTEFTQSMRKQLSNYVDTQIQCASGNCPKGQAEGEYVGIQLSDPELLLPDKEYRAGDRVTVSTDVSGVNLRIYNNIKATTNCSIVKNGPISITPTTVPFADISNNKRTITCTLTAVNTNFGVNTIKTSITFPFNTTSDLPVYIMDESRRNRMMEMWGRNFLSTHYKVDDDPVATFNDGPMNIGIKVTQVPIGVNSAENIPAELVFALFNQWGYYNGEIVSVDNIIIDLPGGMKLSEENDACPFTSSSGHYVLNKKDSENYTIKTVRTFVCELEESQPKEQSFDLWTGHIRIRAQYTYRMTSQMELILKTTSSSDSSASGAGLEALSEDCSDAQASNLPIDIYQADYESGTFNDEIKTGIKNALNQYQPDWLTPDSMRNLLLGIIIEESSFGTNTNMEKNADGIPIHIAGCTSEDKAGIPLYVEYDVEGDILCAAERIDSYVKEGSFCADYINAENSEKLHCALTTYNGHESYAVKVESDMVQWHNYFCSHQGVVQ